MDASELTFIKEYNTILGPANSCLVVAKDGKDGARG